MIDITFSHWSINLTMTINDIQDEIIEEFNDLDDWMDKYQLLIDL